MNGALAALLACAAAAFLLAPAPSFGETGGFTPTILGYTGDLELGMNGTTYRSTYGGTEMKTTETAFHESLRLSATGYVYHPRFLLFTLSGADGLEQQTFDRNVSGTTRTFRSLEEYEVRVRVLPEHPYSLELFAVRMRPITRNRFTPDERTVIDERGAIFRYARKPLFFELSAIDISTKSAASSADAATYRAAGSYTIGPAANSGGYSRTDTTGSPDSRTSQDSYFFINQLTLKPLNLTSRIDGLEQRQSSLFLPELKLETFSWSEQMQTDLPANFRAAASYSVQRSTVSTAPGGLTAGSSVSTGTDAMGLTLSHRLYESLATEAGMTSSSMESSSGDTDSSSRYVTGNYTKRLPGGRLTAGIALRRSLSGRRGAPIILRETHTAAISGDFALNTQNIDASSLSLWVKDPATEALVPLTLNTHFNVQVVGATVRIIILSLPAPFLPGIPYEFSATYSVVPADVELETDSETYSAGLSLFDNAVSSFYRHSTLVQEVLSGALPGTPDASTTDAMGLTLQRAGASFSTSYAGTRSQISPSRTWKSVLDYRSSLDQDLDIIASLSLDRNAYQATPASPESRSYSEKISAVNVALQKRVSRTGLSLSGSMAWSRRQSFIDADTAALNLGLLWRIGKLTVSAGASESRTRSRSQNGDQKSSSENYHVTVSRKLF